MHSDDGQKELITMRLFGLFLKCPFGQATGDCIFGDIRRLPSLELKFRLAGEIAMQPRLYKKFCDTHEACYKARVEGLLQQTAPADQRESGMKLAV